MPLEWWVIFGFAVPAGLALVAPNLKVLAAISGALGTAIAATWLWQSHVSTRPNYDGSPGDAIVAGILVVAAIGLISGTVVRLAVAGINRWLARPTGRD